MFGKMGDMMGMLSKLKDAQKNIEKVKKELDNEFITEINSENTLKVTVSLSGIIQDIDIMAEFDDYRVLQDQLKTLLNDTLSKAKEQYEKKLTENAMEGMPDIEGLLGK